VRISNEDLNTPMYNALSNGEGSSSGVYQRSVQNQMGLMFWLGYLYKKIVQNRCEQRV